MCHHCNEVWDAAAARDVEIIRKVAAVFGVKPALLRLTSAQVAALDEESRNELWLAAVSLLTGAIDNQATGRDY